MTTIVWGGKFGGPAIQRAGDKIPPAIARKLGQRPRPARWVVIVAAILDWAYGLVEWWEDRKYAVYLEHRP